MWVEWPRRVIRTQWSLGSVIDWNPGITKCQDSGKCFGYYGDMLRYIHLIIRPGCFWYRSSQLCHVRRLQLRPHPASFQILSNQKNARRWENDDDVTTCNGCERQFSMTIRKVCFRGLKEDQTSITSSILFEIFFCFLLIFSPSFSASLSELRVRI